MTKRILLALFFLCCLSRNEITDFISPTELKISKGIECLARNIYHESKGESMEGKSAVAQVVLNRMDDKRFPSDVCGVVYQITGKVHQFSWTIKKDKEISDMDMWKDSLDVARNAILNNEAHTELKKSKALFYHATYVKPQWHKIIVAKIGRHIFYS